MCLVLCVSASVIISPSVNILVHISAPESKYLNFMRPAGIVRGQNSRDFSVHHFLLLASTKEKRLWNQNIFVIMEIFALFPRNVIVLYNSFILWVSVKVLKLSAAHNSSIENTKSSSLIFSQTVTVNISKNMFVV